MTKSRNIAVCLACGTILESKHRHDYQECPCPNRTSVDGGTDYVKGSAVDLTKAKWLSDMATAKQLVAENGPYGTVAKPPRNKWFVGCYKNEGSHVVQYHLLQNQDLTSDKLQAMYSPRYFALIGPFKTKRGAIYMRDNPGCETVWDAERMARSKPNNKGAVV